MTYKTELMEEILTSEQAQLFIDKMAPIYGNAYTVLWILQSIGVVLDELMTYPEEIKKQVIPQTATWTLKYWENEYGLPTDETKTIEERQQILLNRIKANTRNNPKALSNLIENETGFKTEIIENVSKNKFKVRTYGYLLDDTVIRNIIERRKPAHLIYELMLGESIDLTFNTYRNVVVLESEKYEVEVS